MANRAGHTHTDDSGTFVCPMGSACQYPAGAWDGKYRKPLRKNCGVPTRRNPAAKSATTSAVAARLIKKFGKSGAYNYAATEAVLHRGGSHDNQHWADVAALISNTKAADKHICSLCHASFTDRARHEATAQHRDRLSKQFRSNPAATTGKTVKSKKLYDSSGFPVTVYADGRVVFHPVPAKGYIGKQGHASGVELFTSGGTWEKSWSLDDVIAGRVPWGSNRHLGPTMSIAFPGAPWGERERLFATQKGRTISNPRSTGSKSQFRSNPATSDTVTLSKAGSFAIAKWLAPFNEPGAWGHVVSYAIAGKPMERKHVEAVSRDIAGYLRSWDTIAKSYGWKASDKTVLTSAKKILDAATK